MRFYFLGVACTTPTTMAKSSRKELFLSYGREAELNHFVHKLKQDLESHGFSVWLDAFDIPAGSDWHDAIGTGLGYCKAIVPIVTKKYIGSRYCMNEVGFLCVLCFRSPTLNVCMAYFRFCSLQERAKSLKL